METNDRGPGRAGQDINPNKLMIALVVLGIALLLTWAVATLFEIALVKALAAVTLLLFFIFIVLLMAGIG